MELLHIVHTEATKPGRFAPPFDMDQLNLFSIDFVRIELPVRIDE